MNYTYKMTDNNTIISEVQKELENIPQEETIEVIVTDKDNTVNTKQYEDLETLFKPYRDAFKTIRTELQQIKTNSTKTLQELAVLEKNMFKTYRVLSQSRSSKIKRKVPREPTGFAKPTVISEELCTFLGKPNGTEMARTEVTKFMSTYIKKHDLQHHKDKRKIVPDRKLIKLLKLKQNDQLTYFNLQRYMKHHFKTQDETDFVSTSA